MIISSFRFPFPLQKPNSFLATKIFLAICLLRSSSLQRFNQCDQIGQVLKVLGDMVSINNSPNASWIFGLKWKATFLMLNYCDYFLGNFLKKIGYFLIYHLVTLASTKLFVRNFCCSDAFLFSGNFSQLLETKNKQTWELPRPQTTSATRFGKNN